MRPPRIRDNSSPIGIICYNSSHMQDRVEISELEAFTRIVDAKSLSRAASELRMPRATIGRRLARLEERLGVRLLKRTTRSLMLTDAGEAFYRHARIALEAVDSATASVRAAADDAIGELRVSLPPVDDPDLAAMMLAFMSRFPRVRVRLDFSTRFVDLQRENYDVALRASAATLEPGLIARTLYRSRLIAAAAPAYLTRAGTPRKAADLVQHRCIDLFSRGELPTTHWPLARGSKLAMNSVLSTNNLRFIKDACLAGHGIALMPELFVRREIDDGTLTHVLSGIIEGPNRVSIVYRERELMPKWTRMFIDELAEWASHWGRWRNE